MIKKKSPITMHIKNSDFSGYSGSVAHFEHRQICDLTTLKGCKFGYFDNRSEIALYFATFYMLNVLLNVRQKTPQF